MAVDDLRFSLTSADPSRLADFYRDALGFAVEHQKRVDASRYGVGGEAFVVALSLGAQHIELVRFEPAGAPYPDGSTSHDGWFQHLALVAADIDSAHARLCAVAGWTSISTTTGPVQLPASSGAVRAFKFRDPEGHPLELLAFPPGKAPAPWADSSRADGPLIGIDHSAIVVADVERSIAFYRALGFAVSAQSENAGPEQDALDGAERVRVSVRAMSRDGGTPHLELLGYHAPAVRDGQAALSDTACTRSVLDETGICSRDPDGHAVIAVRSV